MAKPVVTESYDTRGAECPNCGLQAVVILDPRVTEGTEVYYNEVSSRWDYFKELTCTNCRLVFDFTWHKQG